MNYKITQITHDTKPYEESLPETLTIVVAGITETTKASLAIAKIIRPDNYQPHSIDRLSDGTAVLEYKGRGLAPLRDAWMHQGVSIVARLENESVEVLMAFAKLKAIA